MKMRPFLGRWCEFVRELCGGHLRCEYWHHDNNWVYELRRRHLLYLWFDFLREVCSRHVLYYYGVNKLRQLMHCRIFFCCWLDCMHKLRGW